MTNQELLINRINQLLEDEISSVLNDVTFMLEPKELALKTDGPYCGHAAVQYGYKCQR